MTDTVSDQTPAPATLVTPALSILSACGVFAVLQVIAMRMAGGFEYPLDDPYIHLALSETIAMGGYGVNLQELSSPGSSPLFPLLLLPFNGTDLHRFVPLAWNILGLIAVAWLWGRLLVEAGYCRPRWRALGIAAAVLGPIALMMPMVAFVGMEHSLHAAAALAVVLGLHRHFKDGSGTGLIIAGAFLGTALRFEGAALALLAAGALFLSGKRPAGLVTAVAGLLPIALFTGWLTAIGLDPTPSSVQAKLIIEDELSMWQQRLAVLMTNLRGLPGMLIAALAIAILGLWRLSPAIKTRGWGLFAGVIMLAALAHLVFGQMGWLNRYEHYILVAAGAGFLALLPKALEDRAPTLAATGAVVALLAGGLIAYNTPRQFVDLPRAARAIHTQQGQMAVFAKTYLDTPIAVNDLGWVAFQNPNYVLDLWGLASKEALERRLNDPTPGWTGELTDRHNVPAALVYDHWFEDGLGARWVRIGVLDLTVEGGFLGGYSVAFYATDDAHVGMMRDAVSAWIPTLMPNSRFRWDEGMAP